MMKMTHNMKRLRITRPGITRRKLPQQKTMLWKKLHL